MLLRGRRLHALLLTGLVLGALSGCHSGTLTVHAQEDLVPLFEDFVANVPFEDLALEEGTEAGGKGFHVVVEQDDSLCSECYRLSAEGRRSYRVEGGAPLGVQYGLAHLMEAFGFRFYHPHRARVPGALAPLGEEALPSGVQEPEMTRRGLHLHTLHPTDGMMDFWLPSDEGLERARRVVDWVIKNRGNHLEWMGLDDIQEEGADVQAWREHTTAIIDYAHERGITVGLGVELYGEANLQQAYDLLDDVGEAEEETAQIEERLNRVTEGFDFDVYNLSFGEFFDQDADHFIATFERTCEVFGEQAPDAEVVVWIHVGDDVRVEYEGEDMIFYFLVKYADADFTPSVHTVMYYNLFDDAGGAYHHEEFDEHREYLLERLAAGEPVNYYPESAYWVAFDLPIPVYLPLYIYSRWRDIAFIRDEAQAGGHADLDDHILFSSGWEWGYWQNDYATLRMNWALPDDWRSLLDDMFAPYGESGTALAALVGDLGELQHDYLVEQRLAAYLASYDNLMEAGYILDIVSQPARPGFDEVFAMDAEALDAFETDVLEPLAAMEQETDALYDQLQALELDLEDPWLSELVDGFEIDALRTRFIRTLYQGVADEASGAGAGSALDDAEALLAEAEAVVARRHADLHDPEPERLLEEEDNPTIYNFGYLHRSEELCFWERELLKARNQVEGSDEEVPGCGL